LSKTAWPVALNESMEAPVATKVPLIKSLLFILLCLISLQLSILHPSCHCMCGGLIFWWGRLRFKGLARNQKKPKPREWIAIGWTEKKNELMSPEQHDYFIE
jgi:hypothetical protein